MESWYSVISSALKKMVEAVWKRIKSLFWGAKQRPVIETATVMASKQEVRKSVQAQAPPTRKEIIQKKINELDCPLNEEEKNVFKKAWDVLLHLPERFSFVYENMHKAGFKAYEAAVDQCIDADEVDRFINRMIRSADKASHELRDRSIGNEARALGRLIKREYELLRGCANAVAA